MSVCASLMRLAAHVLVVSALSAVNVLEVANAAGVVWREGSKYVNVAVYSDGSYSVNIGDPTTVDAAASVEWLKGGVNQTIVAPVELTGVRTVHGSQGRLGAFSAVELSMASNSSLAQPEASCGALEHNMDYHGNDIRFVNNITDPTRCCALCVADKACAGFSLMGAADAGKPWARRCYLKSAMVHGSEYETHTSAKVPGRTPSPSPGPTPLPPAPPLPSGMVISLVFTIKYFAKLDLFLFEQKWPQGIELQYTTRSGLAAAFPLFDTASASALSGITWSNEMSGGELCHAGSKEAKPCMTMGGSKAASGFGEGNDAPLVLLNGSAAPTDSVGHVLVLSAFDKFGHQRSRVIEDNLGWGPDLSLAPAAAALPKGYNSSAALFGGIGGVNHVMHEWGKTMQAAYGTQRKTATEDDALTSRVGYWTECAASSAITTTLNE